MYEVPKVNRPLLFNFIVGENELDSQPVCSLLVAAKREGRCYVQMFVSVHRVC